MDQIRALPLLLLVIGALALGQSVWWAGFETSRQIHAGIGSVIGVVSSAGAIILLRLGRDKENS
ncbi:MAG: hypothetical protein AAGL69_14015 [Pseudomonadota bacterium]